MPMIQSSGTGSPEAAVVTGSTIVAHHEVVVGRDGDLLRQVAAADSAADKARMKSSSASTPFTTGWPLLNAQRVARAGDDALDEVRLGLLVDAAWGRARRLSCGGAALRARAVGTQRRVENDDVADRGLLKW